jgi:hypothetical protein
MPLEFPDLAALRAYCLTIRGRTGVCPIQAGLYRDFAIQVATHAAEQPDLAPTDESFLRAVCKGIDGLGEDTNRRIYVPAETLYRLSCFPIPAAADPAAIAAAVPVQEPAPDWPPELPADAPEQVSETDPPKPKRRKRKPKVQE